MGDRKRRRAVEDLPAVSRQGVVYGALAILIKSKGAAAGEIRVKSRTKTRLQATVFL